MQQEMRDKAREALRLILAAAGFEVENIDAPLDLSAVRDDECLLALCSDDPEEIAHFNRTVYKILMGEREIPCKKLLFTMDESVRPENCILWGTKEFARLAGEAVLADILGQHLTLPLSSATPKKMETGETNDGSEELSLPHIPVKVTKQNAERISGVQGSASLRFIPYWFYKFQSKGEQVFRDRRIPFDAEGSGALNAVNGIRIDIDGKNIENGPIQVNAEIIKGHISKEDAHERILSETLDRLTQRVRIKTEKSDAVFYEEKMIKPHKSAVTIEISEIYIPVWQIKGKKIVEVNASTGEVLSEPVDEGVEIL